MVLSEGALCGLQLVGILVHHILEASRLGLVKFALDLHHSVIDLVELLGDFGAHGDLACAFLLLTFLCRAATSSGLPLKTLKKFTVLFLESQV